MKIHSVLTQLSAGLRVDGGAHSVALMFTLREVDHAYANGGAEAVLRCLADKVSDFAPEFDRLSAKEVA